MRDIYLKESIENAVKRSETIKGVLDILGLRAAGGNYAVIKKYVKLYGIDTTHFDPYKNKLSGLALLHARALPIETHLVENSNYGRTQLKKRLYDAGLLNRECKLCAQGEIWYGQKMSLILDHINGVHNDNRIENLRIVCPNCAATLDTHAGKNNRGKYKEPKSKIKYIQLSRRKVKERPAYDFLRNEIKHLGYRGTGKKYGVSDNAIRKWEKDYLISASSSIEGAT